MQIKPVEAASSAGWQQLRANEEPDQPSILSRLRRRKFLSATIFVLGLTLVGGIYMIVPHSYQAEGSIILGTMEPLLGGGDPAALQQQGDPADVESQVAVINAQGLLQHVAAQPAVAAALTEECRSANRSSLSRLRALTSTPTNCSQYLTDPIAGAARIQGTLNISESGRSRVIVVGYNSPIPEVARLIPNAVIDAYIARKLDEKLGSQAAAVTWLRSETARLSTDLSQTDAQIDAFHEQHGLVQGQNASLAAEQLSAISGLLAGSRAAQIEAAAKVGQLHAGADASPDALSNRGIADLKQQLATADAEVASMMSDYGTAYPPLAAVRNRQASLRTQLAAETGRISTSLRGDYAAASARVADLQQQLDQAKRLVSTGSNAETTIANLKRHADVERELYVDLSKKTNALEAERRVTTGSAQVVSYAQMPQQVAFPRKLPFILGGLIFSSVMGLGAALILDRGDRSVRTRHSLQHAIGLPVLGYVPAFRRVGAAASRRGPDALAFEDSVRTLFAQTVLLHRADQARTLLVTSAQAGDGKTFIALALATLAAGSGRRVLAIECDLRRPDFERELKLKPARGLVDLLSGAASIEDIVQPSHSKDLDVIVAGRSSIQSTELLSNGRIDDLLVWARQRYDLVLLDTPPSHALMDASLLARRADTVLFCVRWGASPVELVDEAVQTMVSHGAKEVRLVINRVQRSRLPLYDMSAGYAADYSLRLT